MAWFWVTASLFVFQCLILSLSDFIVGLFDAFKCAEPLMVMVMRGKIYFKAFAFFPVPQETLPLLAKLQRSLQLNAIFFGGTQTFCERMQKY